MPALIKAMLEENQLPWQVPQGLDKSAFLRALFADKKRVQGQLRFVIPQTLGLAKFDVILPIDFNEYAREMP